VTDHPLTIGVDPATTLFNGNVSPSYYANDLSPDQLLTYVLDHPADFGGTLGTAGPYGLTAFNAVGAYLTDQIPGYDFDPSRHARHPFHNPNSPQLPMAS
jgi:hypothetical protein